MALRFLPLCLGFALLFSTQPCSAEDTAAAEALFRSARKAAERGDWVTACDRFEESKRLEPAPGTVLNLARCREKLGQIASAWKSYEEAAQRLPEGDERAAFARQRAQELSPRVPRVVLTAPETDEQISVTMRGVEYSSATFGVPLPLDPGKLTIVVRAKGREDSTFEAKIKEGETLEHQLTLGLVLKPGQDNAPEQGGGPEFGGRPNGERDARPHSPGSRGLRAPGVA
jgi:tetratricopeptide (TPR) repeat protein